jgi:hypothetical protein
MVTPSRMPASINCPAAMRPRRINVAARPAIITPANASGIRSASDGW